MTKDKENLESIIIDDDENVDIEPTPEVMEELAKMMEADRRKQQDKAVNQLVRGASHVAFGAIVETGHI